MTKVMTKHVRLLSAALLTLIMLIGVIGCNDNTSTQATTPATSPSASPSTALTVTKGNEAISLSLEEIKAMPAAEGWGGIMNSSGVISGPFKQKGVALADILDKVGGIGANDALRIVAKDGYSMTYSSDQIMNGNFTTLDCSTGDEVSHGELTVILSYEEGGIPLSEKNGPLRIAILNSDTQVTEGHWWIKWVEEIEVIATEPSWSLRLEGVINEDIDSATFESGAAPGCHGASWTDSDGVTWEGIPLWILVGRVDDDNPHSKESQAFNDAAADAGYNVEVIATDGYSKTFTSAEVKRNNDMIIAYRYNGEPLPEKQWPLRLVGPNLTKGQMVGQVTTIKVVGITASEPEWVLHLEGVLTEDITDSYFAAAYECHQAIWTDDQGRVWEGIPLWLFAGRVDDEFKHNPNQPGAFNDAVADSGYEIEVIAADDYSQTFTSAEVKRNNDMIIAFQRDGGPLPENQWPLRLVGPNLSKSQMVGQIATIKITIP